MKNNFHVHGQNILTLVSMDRVGLIKWATLWKLKESQGSFISKEATPNLFEFYAKHIFSLPVNNVLTERQFNLSQLYLMITCQSYQNKPQSHLLRTFCTVEKPTLGPQMQHEKFMKKE